MTDCSIQRMEWEKERTSLSFVWSNSAFYGGKMEAGTPLMVKAW